MSLFLMCLTKCVTGKKKAVFLLFMPTVGIVIESITVLLIFLWQILILNWSHRIILQKVVQHRSLL